jgi:hypothetical protein
MSFVIRASRVAAKDFGTVNVINFNFVFVVYDFFKQSSLGSQALAVFKTRFEVEQ